MLAVLPNMANAHQFITEPLQGNHRGPCETSQTPTLVRADRSGAPRPASPSKARPSGQHIHHVDGKKQQSLVVPSATKICQHGRTPRAFPVEPWAEDRQSTCTDHVSTGRPRVLEFCAGAGGMALGFERAGFDHVGLVEIDPSACATLRLNRPLWNVVEQDLRSFDAQPFIGRVDVIAAGLPCPPFSKAGKQLGGLDERDLFPAALNIIGVVRPKAVVVENVRGILDPKFRAYRDHIERQLRGYRTAWHLLQASDYGVPQLRPRVNLVAIRSDVAGEFIWPVPHARQPPTVGRALYDLMAENGWTGVDAWCQGANTIAPTLVGGSKNHGGPDLGPTRAREAWANLGINGKSLANQAPDADFQGIPRLTVQMAARIQGFPSHWRFAGGKTAAYRQVGNAFPPPVSAAVATSVRTCLRGTHGWQSRHKSSSRSLTCSGCIR